MRRLALGFFSVALASWLLGSSVAFSEDAGGDRRLILMWQFHYDATDSEFALLNSKGVNLVQSFGITNWKEEVIKEYLDTAAKYKMGVVMTMGRLFDRSEGRVKFDKYQIISFVNRWKDHPACFAWHPFDEPSHSEARVAGQTSKGVYDLIKRADPGGLVMMSWNGTNDNHYKCCFSEEAFDILDLHAYVRDGPGERQRNLLKFFRKYRKKSYPVIITLRCFNGGEKEYPRLPANGVKAQYDFFFKENKITKNVGFYGWKLGKLRGIKDDHDIMRQFKEFDILVR